MAAETVPLLHRTTRSWTISVCVTCDQPVSSCSCDPQDWVSPAGEQLEPPSRRVYVEEVKDAA